MELFIRPNQAERAELLKALSDGGRVSIVILPGKADTGDAPDADATGPVPDDVRQLVDEWNNSEYIRFTAIDENRNNQITTAGALEHLATLKKGLKELGLVGLTKMMASYFDACGKGRHLEGGRNHGYDHLAGFVRYATKIHGRKPWWTKQAPP